MGEIETIYIKKQGLNRAYVFFDDIRKVKAWEEILISNNVHYIKYVQVRNQKTEYGFKMMGVRRVMFTLCDKLKEVLR